MIEEKKPNFSVIIPCYNLGALIDKAIDSVLAQDLEGVEVIVVDDNSNDEATKQKIQELRKNAFCKVIELDVNLGVSAARNRGIELSGAPYIMCLDADDYIEPTYLRKAKEIFDNNKKVGIVSCHVQCFGSNNNQWELPSHINIEDALVDSPVHTASCFRREAHENSGGYDVNLRGYEDWDHWIRIIKHEWELRVIPEKLFNYYIRPNSKVKTSNKNALDLVSKIIENHKDLYEKYFPFVISKKHLIIATLRGMDGGPLLAQREFELMQAREEIQYLRSSKFWILRDIYCKILDPIKKIIKNPLLLFVFIKNRIKIVWRYMLRLFLNISSPLFKKYFINNSPKRVAMVCSTGAVGGAEKVFAKHVEFLKYEFNVDAYFELAGGPVAEDVRKIASRTFIKSRFNELSLANHKYIYLVQSIPDLKLIKKINPDVKISFILHDPVLWVEELKKRSDMIDFLDHIFCISELIRQKLLETIPLINPNKVSVLYNSFSFGQDEYVIKKEKKEKDLFVWGYAGRFSFEKNVKEIIETFGEFKKYHPESKMIVAGDISIQSQELIKYKKEILDLISKTSGVEYWGFQSDLRKFYSEIDGVVMASFIEGISVAALDALSYGIPIVSSNVGSMHEMIENGENGVLFDLDCPPFNPFDNCKLEFSENDKKRFLSAMEECFNKSWKHEKIAINSMQKFSSKSIKDEFVCTLNKMLRK